MGTLQQIYTDLVSLSADSKRRNTDIRHASDKSLELIKSYQSQTHNDDTAAIKLLSKSPEFINPFLLACQSKNIKFTSIALQCLNRLVMVHGLPVSKIDLIIDALLESTHSSLEIQLKILQLLPGFFQNYSLFVSDESLSKLLLVCSSLQSANKMGAVVNTAQATFSQMLNIVFEKVYEEDKAILDEGNTNGKSDSLNYDVPVDDNGTIKVGPCAYDAQRIVNDLCTLIEHHKPSFMKTNYLSEDYGFELLEGIIKNNQSLFLSHVELGYLLRIRVAPILLRFLSSSKDFTVMVRVSRLIFLLINDEFDILRIECEVTLSLLTHTLNKDIGAPQWKKILALEIYNGILKNFPLVKKIYLEYDHNEDEERKKVLRDFLTGCFAIVEDCKQLLNTGDIIQSPSISEIHSAPGTSSSINDNINNSKRSKTQATYQEDHSKEIGLSSSWSSVKQCYIDAIDKQDAPPVPDTYQLYLVSQAIQLLSEGICQSALELATSTDENDVRTISFLDETSFDKEKQFENYQEYICISTMTNSYWKLSLDLYRTFLHSTLDNETFSKLIRSLQKLGHASGILSIKEARTEILNFFASSTLVLKGKTGYQNRLRTIVGTISSTIGQAVSNMATTTHTEITSPISPNNIQLYTRSINSRQTLCFRVLISLGISLAGILEEDWKIILITLQWISYFIDGPSGINTKVIPSMSPFLDNFDLKSFETSLTRFTEGINSQTTEVFHQIISSIHELSEKVLKSSLANPEYHNHEPLNSCGGLEPCIYNKDFYMHKLTDICEINPMKFLISDDKNWEYATKSYIAWSCDRSLDDDTRLLSTRSFDTIVNATANAGFNQILSEQNLTSEQYETTREIVEYKVLHSLYDFLMSLGNLPTSNEQLIMDCEVEMNLQSLNTLKSIIDRFGTVIQSNWNVVTSMLNSPFEFIKNADVSLLSKKSLNDTITSVLRCSFETMKVILDEILQSIPVTQISVIIDTLYNYVNQKFDLNISFNSVSFFWLISDYLKEKIDSSNGLSKSNIFIEDIIHSEDELIKIINSPEDRLSGKETDFHECLLLYLILKLAKTTNDVRTQVRNGSIMTFFNVLNSYGSQCPSWILIYRIVLKPVIMEIKPNSRISEYSQNEQKEWIESYTHVINGISKLFTQYLLDFEQDDNNKLNMISFWKSLIGYMSAMSHLEFNWIELNLHILKAYGGVLQHFVSKKEEGANIPNEIIEEFYGFWVGFQISYNLSNDMLYQESLSAFVGSFEPLFKLLEPILTLSKFEKMLTIFNTCIRYPVLINNQRDDYRCTELQKQVVTSLASLDFEDPKYKSLLIQQLNLIVTLPFSTRELIEKKIGDRGIRIPTFIAASYESISLLENRLASIDDLTPYLNDKCLLKVFKALLEPSTLKNDFKKPDREYLWMESFETVVNLTTRVCRLIEDPTQRQSVKPEIIQQFWPLILEVFKACFIYTSENSSKFEEFDLKHYKQIKDDLIPLLSNPDIISESGSMNGGHDIVEEFIVLIWTSSFLYKLDDTENLILESSISPLEVSNKLAHFNFYDSYGSTKLIEPVPRLLISKACLSDLIELSSVGSHKNKLAEKILPYFVSRCCFVLRKYLSDARLLNKEPLPRIQQAEIKIVLQGLLDIFESGNEDGDDNHEFYSKLNILYPLLLECISGDVKLKGGRDLVRVICIKFAKKMVY